MDNMDISSVPVVPVTVVSREQPPQSQPNKQDTLCIPRMSVKISQVEVRNVIQASGIGKVIEYKEISLRGDREFKRILFTVEWNESHPHVELYRTRIAKNESIKLVYDFPWYWIIVKSNITIWTST